MMRLAGLHVDAYGILHDLTLSPEDLGGTPVVLYGLNEAGKSTLISFVRGTLFGFKGEGSKAEPVAATLPGGWLLLEDEGEFFRVFRSGKGDGKVVVELPDGTQAGEAFLRDRLLHGVSPTFFKNVFAIGIEELRKVDDLKKEAVNSYIYGAGTGVRPEKLAQAAALLRSSLLDLFNPDRRAQKPEINRLLSELDRLDRQIRQLEQQPAQYRQLKAAQAELAKRHDALLEEFRGLRERLRRLENLRKAREPWVKQQNLSALLAAAEPVENFPEDGVSRLERLAERKEEKLAALRKYALAVENLQGKLNSFPLDAAVLEQSAAIKSLDGELSLYLEKRQRLNEAEARMEQLAEQVQEQLADLGPAWDAGAVLALDLSLAVRRRVEDYARALRRQEENVNKFRHLRESCQKEVDEKRTALAEVAGKMSALPPVQQDPRPLRERLAALEGLEQDWQCREQLRLNREGKQERCNDLRLRKDFVENSLQNAARLKEPWWLAAAAALFGLAGLLAAGPGAAGFILLAGGVGLGVLLFFFLRGRAAAEAARRQQLQQEAQALAGEVERLQGDLRRLDGELQEINRRILETAGRLGLAEGFTREDVSRLRRELAKEEKDGLLREELERHKEKAGRELARSLASLEEAEKGLAEEQRKQAGLLAEWGEWCRTKGFPALSPVDLISFLGLAEKARESVKRLNAGRDEYARVKRYLADYLDRVNAVAAALGREPAPAQDAGDCVVRLRETLAEQEKRKLAREQWQKELEEALAGKEAAGAGVEELTRSIRELLDAGGARDPEEFRARAAQSARQKELRQEIAALSEQLLLIAGSPQEQEELKSALAASSEVQIEEELEKVRAQLALTEEEINRLKDELAEKKLRLEQMESGEELALARQEKGMLEERLRAKVREWRVRALCEALLAMARERHERERQPGVLRQASQYLQPMTDGRYTRVVAPLGAPDRLEVEHPDGRRVGAAFLSRGAAHQLYLALRLSLAVHYGSVSAPLPIILDDVLVDFDPCRLAGAVKVLGEIASEHQVLLFTCHSHILEAVAGALPGYKCVTLS